MLLRQLSPHCLWTLLTIIGTHVALTPIVPALVACSQFRFTIIHHPHSYMSHVLLTLSYFVVLYQCMTPCSILVLIVFVALTRIFLHLGTIFICACCCLAYLPTLVLKGLLMSRCFVECEFVIKVPSHPHFVQV